MVVEEVIVHRNDKVVIALAIPIESEPTTEDSVQTLESSSGRHNSNGKLRYSWEVDLGPFKLGRITRQ